MAKRVEDIGYSMSRVNVAIAYMADPLNLLHENARTGGFDATLVGPIIEEELESLASPVRRIVAADTPIPFAPVLEKSFLPQVKDLVAGVRDLANY